MGSFTTNFGEYANQTALEAAFGYSWDSASSDWQLHADATALGEQTILIGSTDNSLRALYNLTSTTAKSTRARVKCRHSIKSAIGPGVTVRGTGGNASADWAGYSAHLRDSGTGTVVIRKAFGNTITIIGQAAFPWSAGTWYWLELEADGGTLTLKAWADGDSEPAAPQVIVTDGDIASGWVALTSSTGSGSREFDSFTAEWDVGSDRVRSSVSEDAGSILDSATLNAVDASFSEAFLLDTGLSPNTQHRFVEALAPGTTVARYYPIPRQSTEFLNDYSGETILSRMTRVYPPAMFGKVADVFAGAMSASTFTVDDTAMVTPQTLIDAVFAEWASMYAWFQYATVPDLRLKVMSPSAAGIATPAEYSSDATLGRVGAPVIAFPQTEDERLTMRQVLDELLSPFPGTVLRANSSGQVQIVPTYGPDASNDPVVTLTTRDAYTVTKGQPSPQGVINKVTVRSQPYVLTEDAGALQQAWFQVESPANGPDERFTEGTGIALGGGENGIMPTFSPAIWPLDPNRIPEGSFAMQDSGGNKLVTIDWKGSDGGSDTFLPSQIELTDIPTDGSEVLAIALDAGTGVYLNLWGSYKPKEGGIKFRIPDGDANLSWNPITGPQHMTLRINLLDASTAWERESTSAVGSYGLVESEDEPLFTVDGANAVAASVAAYGERESEITMTGYGIRDVVTLNRVARAYVLDAINPTLIRTVDQSVWRAFPVAFDDMGRVVELPNGEQGRLTGRTYADDFGTNYGQGSMSSLLKVEVIDQDGDGRIDVDTAYLLDEGGETLLDEAGEPLLDETSGATESSPDPAPSGTTDDGSSLTASSTDSLTTHPKTGSVTSGDYYVAADGSDSNTGTSTGTPFASLAKALATASAGDTILVRAGTYTPAARFVIAKAVNVYNYGTERPTFDGSNLGTGSSGRLFTLTDPDAHVKGFEIRNADGDGGPCYTETNALFEDMIIHDCLGGGVYYYGTGVTSAKPRDIVVYRIGDGSTQGTNVPDGVVVTGGGSGVRPARCVTIDCPDDGFDFYDSTDVVPVDCVAIRPGYYSNGNPGGTSVGDGNGFKLGGSASSGNNRAYGCFVIGARGTSFSHNQAGLGGVEFHNFTSVNAGHIGVDVGSAAGNLARNGISSGDDTSHYAEGSATTDHNTFDLGIADPGFADAAGGDYSLAPGSACIGAASDGGNLGASSVALALAEYWLNQDVS